MESAILAQSLAAAVKSRSLARAGAIRDVIHGTAPMRPPRASQTMVLAFL
jgi:hypothetical protein